jgi:hypothetical protein
MTYFENFKNRWGISSNWQIIIILIVFAITGSSSMLLTKPVLAFFEISLDKMNPFLFYFYKIGIIFIIYQFLLLWFGFLFGQYNFFWKFVTNMLQRMTFGIFKTKKNPE